MAQVSGDEAARALPGLDADLTAYLEAAGGDAHRALALALEDLVRLERALEAARRLVSYGYARGGLPTVLKEP
ncbi:hypothetical protein [Methylobacterium sp. SyP6R]|uniref:hypothetical protein n=1 Tax=Methylobacterium sp. SyP6R TaxID=2718876 RepID=UPI001F31139F|nr:hypothetical protein [Methylobacterium sp. SyP6R]MCF4127555.1 hypothetical protein [Methylobacterium sp. SyP6R]